MKSIQSVQPKSNYYMKQFFSGITGLLLLSLQFANSQSYFDGKFKISTSTYQGYTYQLYQFSRGGNLIKAKYFASDAYSQYLNWKSGKSILLVTAGAFSDSWKSDGKPIGICVDNGKPINRQPDNIMDGMVIVYNGGTQQGGVAVVDMDVKNVVVQTDTGSASFSPRTSSLDCVNFLAWGQKSGVTLFQTQLVYSTDRYDNFSNLYYGAKKERRFLAICRKDNVVHHVVVDAPARLELNLSASHAKSVLNQEGYTVLYIMNLDTGCKNILYAYNGVYLENAEPNKEAGCSTEAVIEKATNLLVYYKD